MKEITKFLKESQGKNNSQIGGDNSSELKN